MPLKLSTPDQSCKFPVKRAIAEAFSCVKTIEYISAAPNPFGGNVARVRLIGYDPVKYDSLTLVGERGHEWEEMAMRRLMLVAAYSTMTVCAAITISAPASALDPRFNGQSIFFVASIAREVCPKLYQRLVPMTAQRAVVVVNALCRMSKDPSEATHQSLNMACIAMKKDNPAIGNLPENTFEGKAVNVCKMFGIDDWESY
jgi:hypothetical protein